MTTMNEVSIDRGGMITLYMHELKVLNAEI